MIFLTTVWVMAWKVATAEKMIFKKIGEYGKKKVEQGYKIFNGLIVCPFCLPNIHGFLFVWPLSFALGVMPLDLVWYKYIILYIFSTGGSCFTSGVLWTLYETLNSKKDNLDSGTDMNVSADKYFENAQKYYYNINKKQRDEK